MYNEPRIVKQNCMVLWSMYTENRVCICTRIVNYVDVYTYANYVDI